ncbi:FtsB family cell division protein [Streptococcus loxodontisalivarius]|uniref:Cell division protein FtsB n=1 Tax=Streptococcus loxodontisalivarius TaxID=1349415 RepID=A0ABS2PPH1_9STRE|nr:septum formation initiator family protein [Streptococcus loxodontisalivarius]MBM7641870.1 cell division protein FtsB [Streptococcus loxodontisalivarius]
MPKKKPSVVQLNNDYIQDENQRKRYEEEEIKRRNRFMGWVMLFVMLLFILPTYNLVSGYQNLKQQEKEVSSLKADYKTVQNQVTEKQALADSLKNSDYVAKYARAKYYYSISGETIYLLPELVPQ